MPSRNLVPGSLYALLGAIMVGLAGIFNFRKRAATEPALPRDGETQP
jgi:LPXTG-motif cell wall-anchored protein